MIQKTMYVIAVQDLAASAAWYRDVLGFAVREIGDPGWRILERDNCRIMAGHCADATPAGQLGDHSYFAYFTVSDVDTYHAQVAANGGQIIKTPRTEPWGMREFAVRTLDGHRIMIGQEMS